MTGQILLKEKQVKILMLLKNTQQKWHISALATASGTTYVHTHNFLKNCTAIGITSIEKHGKLTEIKLTEKGIRIVDALTEVTIVLNQTIQTTSKAEEKGNNKKEEKGKAPNDK